jgi:magnesium-transporting ATPase (P-type)
MNTVTFIIYKNITIVILSYVMQVIYCVDAYNKSPIQYINILVIVVLLHIIQAICCVVEYKDNHNLLNKVGRH